MLIAGFLESRDVPVKIESRSFRQEPVTFGNLAQVRLLVPAEWVANSIRSTAPHTEPGHVIEGTHVLAEGYGYQWWIPGHDDGSFSAIGVYNQFVYVHPSAEVTIVKLSANRAFGTTTDEAQNREGETLAFLRACALSIAGG